MISSKNSVILVAIENELPESLIPDFKVTYTGVGKINATIKTIESIEKYKPEYIINYGSAGSLNSTISGLSVTHDFTSGTISGTGDDGAVFTPVTVANSTVFTITTKGRTCSYEDWREVT